MKNPPIIAGAVISLGILMGIGIATMAVHAVFILPFSH